MADEPKYLRTDHTGDVDIDVSDLESTALTKREAERIRNSVWKEARVAYEAKAIKDATRREREAAMAARIDQLETALALTISKLIPGLSAPQKDSK